MKTRLTWKFWRWPGIIRDLQHRLETANMIIARERAALERMLHAQNHHGGHRHL